MGQEPDTTVDFGKLNAAERTALNLLAQGHTAKSIATLTDRSVGAVNERLREARRKTGIGSSRELARLFAAQENRDELFGMAPAARAASDLFQPGATRRRWKGIAIMLAIVIAGAVPIAALTLSPDHSAKPVPQTSLDKRHLDPTYQNDAYWHRRVTTEARDARWAPEAERNLHAWLAIVADVEDRDHPMQVYCASSACEVNGALLGGNQRVSAALQNIQTRAGEPLGGATPLSVVSFSFIMDDQGKFPRFRIHYIRNIPLD